ncbi:sulfite exporter TauE/SafE family protein [Emticicia fluvialis]|uniref:sulfite exporter TauE/SafE family protein n=1 Tax=Emticicia fluvialis TaxID=2974474 RepID=UPI002164FE18|nr:sulfite exporter TauE/SafE family protein [Emticicia fluvialis]
MNYAPGFLFYFLTLLAEIIGTIGGFGSSVFFVPIANHFLSFHQVLGILSLLHIFSNLSKIVLFRKGFNKSIFLKIGIPSIIFVIIGAYFSKYVNTSIANLLLGLFLSLFAGLLILKPDFAFKPTLVNAVIGGGLSGGMAGWLGTGGAVRGLALASFNVQKDTFLATSALIDFMVDLSRFGVYSFQGYLTRDMLWQAPALLVISFTGSWLGKRLLNHIPQEPFRKLSLWLILLIGVYSLIQYWVDRQ